MTNELFDRHAGGPSDPGELASKVGAGTSVATGPVGAVVGGLLQAHVPEEELQTTERRLAESAVLLLSDELDDAASQQLMELLRERGAEHINSSSA